MIADLRAGIEALCAEAAIYHLVNGTSYLTTPPVVLVSDLRALLAAHPVQDEVTFKTTLLDPVWLTTSSSRCRQNDAAGTTP